MCGIGGYILRQPTRSSSVAESLLDRLRYRGPDDEGVALIASESGSIESYHTERTVAPMQGRLARLGSAEAAREHDVALVHTRYAIIDLTERAHQPFVSGDGTLVASYNGEIYNFRELADELRAAGVALRTTSDTEVLVEGYRLWRDDVWCRLNGFWALIMYDAKERCVVLSRDRMGVAPLYCRETADGLYFASAIRPLLEIAPDGRTIDVEVARGFVDYGLKDFDDATFYRDVRSLPPATTLRLAARAPSLAAAERLTYWRYPTTRWRRADLSLGEAATRLRNTLLHAVELRLRADVPVAFELSGGLDSSSIVAAAAAVHGHSIATYTVSVPGRDDEPFARAMRDRYNLDYHVLAGDESQFDQQGPEFAGIMEEPYHSPNTYTAWRMRHAMKEDGVAVAVSGSGGDETLAGYEYEFWSAASRALRGSGQLTHAFNHAVAMRFGSAARSRLTAQETIGWLKRALHAEGKDGGAKSTSTRAASHAARYESLSFQDRSLYQFEIAHLPYYLRSNDHQTMSIPLEARFPFLDWQMVELGLQLPIEYLFRHGWSKYVLRCAMESLLPESIAWRRDKMGFPFPLTTFLESRRAPFTEAFQRAIDAGLAGAAIEDWDALLQQDPTRLWRIVSTGMWLAASG